MGNSFSAEWYPLLRGNGLPTEWPEEYLKRWAGVEWSEPSEGQGGGSDMEDVRDDFDD